MKGLLSGVAVVAILGGIVGTAAAFGSFYTIDQGDLGVITRTGAVIGVAKPGFHWKLPFVDDVHEFSVRTKKMQFVKLHSYSKDIQPAIVQASVNYNVDPRKVEEIYGTIGLSYADVLIAPAVLQITKEVFGTYQARDIVSQREKLGGDVRTALAERLGSRGIIIESVQLENIDFSKAYEEAIENAMRAEAEVKKVAQELERQRFEAQKRQVDADAAAYALFAAAKAQADATRVQGEAEADAIRAKASALAQNTNLVTLQAVERWDGKLPQTQVPGSAVPFIGVK